MKNQRTDYEKLIMEILEGETPEQKYEYLREMIILIINTNNQVEELHKRYEKFYEEKKRGSK